MQIRISSEAVKTILHNAECKILQESEKTIVTVKTVDYGRIHIRLKRYAVRYALKERHYWLANIHFEKGLRPQRLFDSKEIKEFIEKHVKPFMHACMHF